MAAEAVKVIVRCRPLNNREKSLECKDVVTIDSVRGQCGISNPSRPKEQPKTFSFDGAFGIDSTTEQIYADIVYPLVDGVTDGYNGTIFAYGQTGCGKSFTMQGVMTDAANKGVTPRSFEQIFETTAASADVRFLVHASFLEIYNEEIRDLLGKDQRAKYDLKEHPERGVFVSGLSMHKVKSVDDCHLIMEQGWKNRHVGATLMNADSSRSHSLFTIYLEMAKKDADSGNEHICAGKLNLVDLAGSERQSKTGATGDRLKEATKINLSLSALGNVISALVDASAKHIPYRDSKLTRLLQDSLGGNTKTLMIACLSPADNNYEETLSTLRYANRAKNIKNKPTINEDPKDALLRQYSEEIARLKSLLDGKTPLESPSLSSELSTTAISCDGDAFVREKDQLREEYERRLKEKELLYATEAANSARLQADISRLKEMYDAKIQKLETKYKTRNTSVDDQPTCPPLSSFAGVIRRTSDSESLPTLRLDKLSPLPKRCSDIDLEPALTPGAYTVREGSLSSRTYRLLDGSVGQRSSDEGHANGCLRPVRPQFAVHLASTSLVGVTTPLDGISGEYDKLTKDELLRRLRLLQEDMVGGEEANNAELHERQSRRRQHAEKRKLLLAEANAKLENEDDDGIMVGIYESIQDELRHKNKLLQKEKQKRGSLETEIEDIQHEFERDREDYLEAIRKQQGQIALFRAILDKIQPCIRRDSNYSNLDKIKKQAYFDEESNEWILPVLSVERTALPHPMTSSNSMEDFFSSGRNGGSGGYSHGSPANSVPMNGHRSIKLSNSAGSIAASGGCVGIRDSTVEKEEETRFYAKLASRSQNHTNYFANKRKEQLLMDAAFVSSRSAFRSCDRPIRQSEDHLSNNCNLLQSPPDTFANSRWVSKSRIKGADATSQSSSSHNPHPKNKHFDV